MNRHLMIRQWIKILHYEAYVVLSQLDLATDACDIDDRGSVPRNILAAFRKKTKEGCGHEEDGERVDAVDAGPALEGFPFEETAADRF